MKDKKQATNVMLVNIALNAATVCTACACTKCFDETQTRPTGPRPRRWGFCL